MNAEDVAYALCANYDAPFYCRRWIVVPNVSWGLLPYEADLLAVSKSHYATEIEIKVSLYDFRADQRKYGKFGGMTAFQRGRVHKFFYAVPESIGDRVAAELAQCEHRGFAGLYVVTEDRHGRRQAKLMRPAKPITAAPLSDADVLKVARLGVMRYWTRRIRHHECA